MVHPNNIMQANQHNNKLYSKSEAERIHILYYLNETLYTPRSVDMNMGE